MESLVYKLWLRLCRQKQFELIFNCFAFFEVGIYYHVIAGFQFDTFLILKNLMSSLPFSVHRIPPLEL